MVHVPAAQFLDLLRRIALGKVDGDAAYLLGLVEALFDAVDDVDERGAAEFRRVRSHKADRARAKYHDRLARLEAGELYTVPALQQM